jgi:hypothetical protein
MSSKALIGGTARSLIEGKTLINGTAYTIKEGRTLIDGTARKIPLQYTITYCKVYNMDYPSMYPPAENTGPVGDSSGNYYYLRVEVRGQTLSLGDKFTENNGSVNHSPFRTHTAPAGSQIYIQLINKGSGNKCRVWVNDVLVAGPLEYCYYTTYLNSNLNMTFTWESEGDKFNITGAMQSWYDCRIYTA